MTYPPLLSPYMDSWARLSLVVSHSVKRPLWQDSQLPQAMSKQTTARSPFLKPVLAMENGWSQIQCKASTSYTPARAGPRTLDVVPDLVECAHELVAQNVSPLHRGLGECARVQVQVRAADGCGGDLEDDVLRVREGGAVHLDHCGVVV